MAARDGADVQVMVRRSHIAQLRAHYIGVVVYLDTHKHKFTLVELEPLTHP